MWWLAAVLAGIFLFLFLKKSWEENSQGVKLNDGSTEESEALENIVEMEDAFFEAVRGGKKSIKFMYLFYQEDIMIIKSLFQNEGIPFRTENEHLSSILVGSGVAGTNYTAFYILREDYEDALKIVKEYAENKHIETSDKVSTGLMTKFIDFVSAANFIPKKTETSGIIIFKLEKD